MAGNAATLPTHQDEHLCRGSWESENLGIRQNHLKRSCLESCWEKKGSCWKSSLSCNAAPPAQVPCHVCTQAESSWCNLRPELRILSSLPLDFHSLMPRGPEVLHTHLGFLLGSTLALEYHMKVLEQNMSAGCKRALEHCKRALEHHNLVCNLDTKVFQAPFLCPCYDGFSM